MPPLPSVSQVVRVDLKYTWSNDVDVLNRFFVIYTGPAPTVAQLNTFSGAVRSAWNTNLKAFAQTAITLTQVEATDLSSASSARGLDATAVAGTRNGAILPGQTAVVIRLAIARRYRGGKPRIYMPLFDSTDLNNGQTWKPASTSSLLTSINAFFTAVLAAPWASATLTNLVNISYYNGFHNVTYPSGRTRSVPTLRGTPLTDAVTAFSINPAPGTQRRRAMTP